MPSAKSNPIYLLVGIAETPEVIFRNYSSQYSVSIVEADSKGFWQVAGCEYDYRITATDTANKKYYKHLVHQLLIDCLGHSTSTLRFGYNRRFNDPIREIEAESMFSTLKHLSRRIEDEYQHRGEIEGLGGAILRSAFALKAKGIFVQDRFKSRALPLDLETVARLNRLFDSAVAECKVLDEKPIDSVVIARTNAITATFDEPWTRTLTAEDGTRLVEIPFADSAWENQASVWRKANYHVDVVNVQKATAYA